ncbi:antibiotic biosynthesis monooxygenase [Paenibacillus sp. IB182496]|uniref:Antibiotic biosynthesis monooxygenase n=1 Tax=Paenibacillus sabuli TaxID=2772509 RepID=A0A927GT05_9BACL|nr:putative quinol monooxygenase [Paenibacillus sabuli]MBD2846585.1 antibiotic biosynthesis monooxygenase [Paenibacillus sabuli]
MLKIVAKRYLKPDTLDEYLVVVRPLVNASRQEPGCIEYALYFDRDEYAAVMMETWESEAALEEHLKIIRAVGYPEKLERYADPAKPSKMKKYNYVY